LEGFVQAPRILYVVTKDWYFLSHRLPMAMAAREAGYEVHVACDVDLGAAAIASRGFVLHPIAFSRGQLAPAAHIATIRALRALYNSVDPDLLHHVGLQVSIVGSIAALGSRAKCVNAITGLGYAFAATAAKARLVRTLLRPLMRWLFNRRTSIALVQNPDDRAILEAVGVATERIVLVPGSGVDVDALTPLPEPAPPVTAAFVGRLVESKGIRILVAANRLLQRRRPDIKLLIAGAPDLANPASLSLREAESLNDEPGVRWLGHVDDIASVWRRAHIAILPAIGGEGLPKSLLEAAACGRSMIATDVPGCREVAIAGTTALVVKKDDPQALAVAIEELADAPNLRAQFGREARKMAEERFAARTIGAEIIALYGQLLKRPASSGGA
jgi:glycosyltransferase involved in cell wall biosynthesis